MASFRWEPGMREGPELSSIIESPAQSTSIITARDDASVAPTSSWTPAWTWYGSGKQCPPDVSSDCPCLTNSECGFQCPQQWPDTSCVWKAVFENKNDWNEWKSGKYTPVTTGYVSKDTFELDCKKLCEAHDKCNSCQAFSLEEQAEQFICALFEEYIDGSTWESDCEADKADSKYYNTSCWNSKS
ncbi:hypothetical protein EV421DRAFT_1975715 [Armillaria borealis]|uniref:Uncharacterized protein n=1 Tax=Armillaria borealis TaxID=47425 RepID=A0AA39K103_9AGAR|nr:hypothetical protein EV421DRAFT_1975715 [Armillaria borealis]